MLDLRSTEGEAACTAVNQCMQVHYISCTNYLPRKRPRGGVDAAGRAFVRASAAPPAHLTNVATPAARLVPLGRDVQPP
eukprot:7637052-Alexandrium_andersonii.AAC.1